jgi:integrase
MSAKSNRRSPRKPTPPPKPYEGFPLSPHASGKYQKMIKGKIYYFGAWAKREQGEWKLIEDGWVSAEAEFKAHKAKQDKANKAKAKAEEEAELERRKAELEKRAAEQEVRVERVEELRKEVELLTDAEEGPLRLAKLCNVFLDKKRKQMERKELTQETYDDYERATDLLLDVLGKDQIVGELKPANFSDVRAAMADKWESPVRITKFITMTRTMFKVAYENEWIEAIPNYGTDFKRPPTKRFKEYKNEGGDRHFTRSEVLRLLHGGWVEHKNGKRGRVAPTAQMRAMILLGVNCGFGNRDIAMVPVTAFNLKGRFVRFPRPKTGVERECPLWPETIDAIAAVIAERPETNHANLFITKYGNPWAHGKTDAIKKPFGNLLKALQINGRRSLGFYSLRHTFATVGMELNDRDAVKGLLGHTDPEMVARYNHGQVPFKRRVDVVNYVRKWLSIARITR